MRISIPAIVLGLVISFILDVMISYVLLFSFGWSLANSMGPSARNMPESQLFAMALNSNFFVIGNIIGAALSGSISTYCMIRLADWLNPLLHSVIFTILAVALSLTLQLFNPGAASIPGWVLAMSYAFAVVGSLFVGVIAQLSIANSEKAAGYA